MSAPRGTTPTFTLQFSEEELDLTQAENVYVTIQYGRTLLTKTGSDLDIQPKQISLYLTQQETLDFPEGNIDIQANWTAVGGGRCASDVVSYRFTRQLLNEVIA